MQKYYRGELNGETLKKDCYVYELESQRKSVVEILADSEEEAIEKLQNERWISEAYDHTYDFANAVLKKIY